MPKDKSTGKKLADMLYGNPNGAAFGVFPQMKPKRSKQDPEAAKNFPVDLARGVVAGALGIPGDIESLARLPYELYTGNESPTFLPTSEDVLKRIPFGTDTPAGQFASGIGTLAGGSANLGAIPRAVKAAPGALKTAARNISEPRTLNPQAGVIKMKGGNWLGGSVDRALEGLKRPDRATGGRSDPKESMAEMKATYTPEALSLMSPETQAHVARAMQDLERKIALNNWVDRNLGNYVKKEMATPEDPVRKLAEEGITHLPVNDIDYVNQWIPEHLAVNRMNAGFPSEGMGKSNFARGWETLTDNYISSAPAREYTKPLTESESRRGLKSVVEDNPWLSKLDPETQVTYLDSPDSMRQELGFDHILDVLREDVTSGRIRPEQLSKVSMEQAVRRTAEYDQELAAKMNAERTAKRAGLPVYKEYPEGYRWVELNRPGAFASESEAMGHSVRGYEPPQGHPDWVAGSGDRGSLGYGHGGWEAIKSGKAKVYSLVDSNGNPHVTVEVGQNQYAPRWDSVKQYMDQAREQVMSARSAKGLPLTDQYENEIERLVEATAVQMAQKNSPPMITQIKGKQNAAPKEDYLPFVQDFVKSGQWSDVGDLQNTGLRRTSDAFNETEQAFLRSQGVELKPYIEPEETARYQEMFKRTPDVPPEGMAHGGRVHISDNPDVMQLELAKGGAVAALKRLARATPKTKQEIEAIAERMAPQVTGEYVRESPKSAKTVAGKTQKQFQREKTLPVDVRATDKERIPQTVDIEKLKGDVMIGIPGDPTLAGKTLYGFGDVKLGSPSPQHGGPLYGLYNDENFWASGLGAARRVQNLAKEAGEQYDAPVAGKYIMMGPDSINYAQHFADANLQAIDLGRMTKKQVEQFNKLIRFGNPKSGPRPSFPGIEDKESAYLHMAMDPELRKHFNELMQKPTVTETLNLPSGTDIRFAITEPALRDLETGVTGFSIGRMRPEISSKDLPLSTHPTYSHDIPGEFMGQSRFPIPYELSFPDTLKSIRENPAQAPHEFGSLKMVGPRQTIDQQMIDEIKAYEERMKQLTGKKAGGAVRKAAGGEITADDLILEERKL